MANLNLRTLYGYYIFCVKKLIVKSSVMKLMLDIYKKAIFYDDLREEKGSLKSDV